MTVLDVVQNVTFPLRHSDDISAQFQVEHAYYTEQTLCPALKGNNSRKMYNLRIKTANVQFMFYKMFVVSVLLLSILEHLTTSRLRSRQSPYIQTTNQRCTN